MESKRITLIKVENVLQERISVIHLNCYRIKLVRLPFGLASFYGVTSLPSAFEMSVYRMSAIGNVVVIFYVSI